MMTTVPEPERYVTRAQPAEIMGVSLATIDRIGRRWHALRDLGPPYPPVPAVDGDRVGTRARARCLVSDRPKPKLTAAQAGEYMGLTARQVLDLARQGRLPHIRYSPRIVRFDVDDIEAWIEARKQGPVRPRKEP